MLNNLLTLIDKIKPSWYVIFFLGLFSCSFGFSQDIDCSNFKRGVFLYTPPNGGEVKIKRTKNKQIEKYNNENQRFIFKIEWVAACEYNLVLHRTVGVDRKIKKEILGTKLNCKVIRSELDHYIVTLTPENISPTETITIYKK